ncbi:hypothetical protein [Lactococcus allomyrinae]|nr:hypothetical protein [Lactococcus allomyrinae]
MENPKKILPRIFILTTFAIVVFYVLIQVVAVGILESHSLSASSVPIQDAFEKVAGSFDRDLIAAGVVLSTGGLLYLKDALTENKMLSKVVARRNRFNAPCIFIIIIPSIIVLVIAWSGAFSQLALISALSHFAQYVPTCLAVLVFAKTKKEVKQSFRLPFG